MPDDVFDEIIQAMKKYHPSHEFGIVEKAYELAQKAHGDQRRASGEPYILHPLEVAKILTGIELDRDTIAAAILHDVIEDTEITFDDVERSFNGEIAMLVEGVTKLEKVNYQSSNKEYDPKKIEVDNQADTYRKMFLHTVNDPRVLIIKIADRLHNMRTISHMPPNFKKRKSEETMAIYAPLAHRLGISKLRYELEDLAFRYQDPVAYNDLKEKISLKQNEREELIQDLVLSIRNKAREQGLEAEVIGRKKHFFSIYKKMMQQDKTLDQIYDLHAVRVLTEDIAGCYQALGILHGMYTPVPGRYKDYIAMPKPNNYQSIHNTLMGPGGEPFEIQIRTFNMDRVSDYGVAAHWMYKTGGGKADEVTKMNWLRQMMEWQRDLSENADFLDELKSDLNPFKGRIYCFTPKGMPIELVAGATPIDFAYAIHSAVGNRMTGAKVNNRIAPLGSELQSGDQVEIITSNNTRGPSRDWLKLCKTSHSRAKINAWFKAQSREENIMKGRELLEEGARKKDLTLAELIEPRYLSIVLQRYSFNEWDTLCAAVGHGNISESQVINRLFEEYQKHTKTAEDKDEQIIQLINEGQKKTDGKKDGSGISIKGDKGMSVRLSNCCLPILGDEIVGYITRGRGVSIHRSDCVNILHLDDLSKRQLMQVEWAMPEEAPEVQAFNAAIDVLTRNRPGVVSDISRVIMDEKINMDAINTYKQKDDVLIRVVFPVNGKAQLEKVMAKIGSLNGIYEVKRTVS